MWPWDLKDENGDERDEPPTRMGRTPSDYVQVLEAGSERRHDSTLPAGYIQKVHMERLLSLDNIKSEGRKGYICLGF
jgi:hypothetical protein